jgi:hypothetical protein
MLNRWLSQLRRELFGTFDPAAPAPATTRLRRKSRRRTILDLERMEERVVPATLTQAMSYEKPNQTEFDLAVPAGDTVTITFVQTTNSDESGNAYVSITSSLGFSKPGSTSTTLPVQPLAPNATLNVFLANNSASPDTLTLGSPGFNTVDTGFSKVNIGANPTTDGSLPTSGTMPESDQNDSVTLNSLSLNSPPTTTTLNVSAGTINFPGATSVPFVGNLNVSDIGDGSWTFTTGNQVAWNSLGFKVGDTITANTTANEDLTGTFQNTNISGETLTATPVSGYNSSSPSYNDAVVVDQGQGVQVLANTISLNSVNSLTYQSTGMPYQGAVTINTAPSAGQPFAGDPYITGPDWAAYGYTPGEMISITFNSNNSNDSGYNNPFVVVGTVGDNLYLGNFTGQSAVH